MRKKARKSFTLIELLVVIAIIGLLATIVLLNLQNVGSQARITSGLKFAKSVQHALGAYAVGIWDLNKIEASGKLLDSSGYENHCTPMPVATPPTVVVGIKQLGNALNLNGTSQYLDCGTSDTMNFISAFTIEAWAKSSNITIGSYRPIFSRIIPTNQGYAVLKNASNGTVYIRLTNLAGGTFTSAPDVFFADNVWTHIAVTFSDNNNTLSLYKDGALFKRWTTPVSLANTPNTPTFIGRYPTAASAYYWNGQIDEVHVYEIALSSAEIQKHYAEGLERHKNLAAE